MKTMHLDGYTAVINYDEDIDSFFGEVINLSSVVTFYGDTPEALRKEFKKSLTTYFEVCKERNITPEKPFSGKLNLRLGHELHSEVAVSAACTGKSINSFIVGAVKKAVHDGA